MSNSSLVSYTKISPNKNSGRNHKIDRISPHCVVGQLSVETLGNIFASPSAASSSNYGIGSDGRVGMYVEEKDRSWCTSDRDNDNHAVTIECASDTTHPYAFNDKVYNKLIELCIDICKRNGKTKLLFLGSKEATLKYIPKSNEMLITVHRWFANKACPGDWLYSRLGDLADKVTAKLGSSTTTTSSTYFPKLGTKLQLKNIPLYVTSTTQKSSGLKTGVFYIWSENVLNNRIRVTNTSANVGKIGQITGWIDIADARKTLVDNSTYNNVANTSFKAYKIKVSTDALNIREGAGTNYKVNGVIRDKGTYTIIAESSGSGANKWGKLKSGIGWISLDYCKKV